MNRLEDKIYGPNGVEMQISDIKESAVLKDNINNFTNSLFTQDSFEKYKYIIDKQIDDLEKITFRIEDDIMNLQETIGDYGEVKEKQTEVAD